MVAAAGLRGKLDGVARVEVDPLLETRINVVVLGFVLSLDNFRTAVLLGPLRMRWHRMAGVAVIGSRLTASHALDETCRPPPGSRAPETGDTGAVSTRTSNIQFDPKPDARGYWTTADGRWKAKNHMVRGQPRSVTLTDTTRRAIFADTGASWTRVASWDAVRDVIASHG